MIRALPLVLLAVVLAACGGDGGPTAGDAGVVRGDGPEHIHAIGLNPRDGALILATHRGLFRAGRDKRSATRIGDRRRDTMGLTIAGPDRFLASGHPEVGERLPPSLGLLRSSDGGQSWQPVSLLGRADLHVLRASGRHVYGYDAGSETLLASTDGGRTWSARRPSTALIDLALDPRNAEHLVAATPEGLLRSRDAGRTWRPAGPSGTGLLVWSDALYLVGSDGVVVRSRDGGRNWEGAGAFEGRPVAASGHGTELVVATEQGRVLHSVDRARTWRPRLD